MLAPSPNSKIQLFNNINIDINYEHTLYFASVSAQNSFFAQWVVYSADKAIYVRENGRIRLPFTADTLIGCNYLRYQNTGYLNRWFYAFIKNIFYINDNTCEIEFEIDVIQSFKLYCEIPACWIERNHVYEDWVGSNRVEENISIGEYVVDSESKAPFGNNWSVIMYSSFNPTNYETAGGELVKGMYSALDRTEIGKISIANGSGVWVVDARDKIKDIVTNHADKVEGVISIVLTPTEFEGGLQDLVWTIKRDPKFLGVNVNNNKLFTAPFYCLYVSTGSEGKLYDFDDSTTGDGLGSITFNIESDLAPTQSVSAIPISYKGSSKNFSEMCIMTGFPQCAWVSDSFKTYLAENSANLLLSSALAVGQIAGGIAIAGGSGGAALPIGGGMIVSGAMSVGHILADVDKASRIPPKVSGNITGTALYSMGNKTFRAYILRPRDEYVTIIDDYFTHYGYAIHKVEIPAIHNRESFTFIQTKGCVVRASANSEYDACNAAARAKIAQIFDKGITFWVDNANVGNYKVRNKPLE